MSASDDEIRLEWEALTPDEEAWLRRRDEAMMAEFPTYTDAEYARLKGNYERRRAKTYRELRSS